MEREEKKQNPKPAAKFSGQSTNYIRLELTIPWVITINKA